MRKGEILGLAWADVDLVERVVIARDTKNGTDRPLALRGPALVALQDWSHRRRNDSDLVFPGKSGLHPLEIKKAWYAALEEAEIENFRFHDLRHTAARYPLKSKASMGELAEVLGHRTLDMVKRYTDAPDDHTVAVVERMNKEVFGD